MKVLLVNWIYGWGSTGHIVEEIKSYLCEESNLEIKSATVINKSKDKDVFLFSNRRIKRFFVILTRFGWPTYLGSTLAAIRLIRYIKKENFDIVHLHCLNGTSINLFMLLRYLAKKKINTIITHHAEFYYTGSCSHSFDCQQFIYNKCKGCHNLRYSTGAIFGGNAHRNWKWMKKAFSRFDKDKIVSTAVSPWVKSRVEKSSIMSHIRCEVVMNGVDTSIFNRLELSEIRFKEGISDDSFVLYVSANFDSSNEFDVKGGFYLVQIAKRFPNLQFVVVATNSTNCDNLPPNILFYGRTDNQKELASLYKFARVTLLTSRRETFSMVTAESLCCGTPVVGFKAGGPESIALDDFTDFVDYPDIKALEISLSTALSKKWNREEISLQAQKKYSKCAMSENYLKVYKSFR